MSVKTTVNGFIYLVHLKQNKSTKRGLLECYLDIKLGLKFREVLKGEWGAF